MLGLFFEISWVYLNFRSRLLLCGAGGKEPLDSVAPVLEDKEGSGTKDEQLEHESIIEEMSVEVMKVTLYLLCDQPILG